MKNKSKCKIDDSSRFARYNVASFLRYFDRAYSREIKHEERRIEKATGNEILFADIDQLTDYDYADEKSGQISLEDEVADEIIRAASKSYFIGENEVLVHGAALTRALDSLPPKKRNTILLTYFSDLTDMQIGETLHVTRNTVINRRREALKLLRIIMEVQE